MMFFPLILRVYTTDILKFPINLYAMTSGNSSASSTNAAAARGNVPKEKSVHPAENVKVTAGMIQRRQFAAFMRNSSRPKKANTVRITAKCVKKTADADAATRFAQKQQNVTMVHAIVRGSFRPAKNTNANRANGNAPIPKNALRNNCTNSRYAEKRNALGTAMSAV